jgi:hypothetical protein
MNIEKSELTDSELDGVVGSSIAVVGTIVKAVLGRLPMQSQRRWTHRLASRLTRWLGRNQICRSSPIARPKTAFALTDI